MKRSIRSAVRRGISESDLNGYKWEITMGGIKWEYCDVEFIFKYHDLEDGNGILNTHQLGHEEEIWTVTLIGNDRWDDASTIEEAYRIATKRTIAKANHLF